MSLLTSTIWNQCRKDMWINNSKPSRLELFSKNENKVWSLKAFADKKLQVSKSNKIVFFHLQSSSIQACLSHSGSAKTVTVTEILQVSNSNKKSNNQEIVSKLSVSQKLSQNCPCLIIIEILKKRKLTTHATSRISNSKVLETVWSNFEKSDFCR